MSALLMALGLVGLVALFVLILGSGLLACSARGRTMTGLELLAYSVAFGILAMAVIGAAVVSVSPDYARNAWELATLATTLALVQWKRTAVYSRLFGVQADTLAVHARLAMVGWLLMAAIPMGLTFVPIKMPAELPDGAYVIKDHNLHVRLQVMMGGFPADNYIPFVASQYLLRDIALSEERPLMPGQELANRPILMPLAALPLLAMADAPPKSEGALPTFRYVGKQWPDVGRFGDDISYRRFLAVALVLNASLFIAAALLFQHFGLRRNYWVAGLLVIGSSPYFIGQTLFAWPKSLAAFYLILGVYTLLARERTWVAGLLVALAYWAHPYAVVFIAALALYLLIRERNDPNPQRGLLPFGLMAAAGLAVWWGWAQWYLQIPSDLVEQNFGADGGLVRQASIRFINTINTIVPVSFSNWPSADQLVQASILGLTGGVGLLLLPQAALASVQCLRQRSNEFLILLLLPAALLIGVFSILATPAVHGFQGVAVVFLMLALGWMQRRGYSGLMMMCVVGQLAINIGLMMYRGWSLSHG